MRLSRQITQFGHVVSALGGEAQITYAKDAKNVRLDGFKLAPRYGFANVAVKPGSPSDTFECFGLGVVTNTSGTTEGLSVENRAGVCNLYSVNVSTFARTAITATTVPASKASVVGYNDNSYIIFPGQAKSVWKHEIGNASSLSAVADTAYSASPSPNLTITQGDPVSISTWASTDTISYVNSNAYAPGTITPTFNADGSILLNGPSTDSGGAAGGYLEITQVFAASKDLSGADYFYVNLDGQAYLKYFTAQTTLPQFRIAGVWTNVTDAKWFFDSTTKEATWVIYARGLTITAIEGFRFRMSCKPGRAASFGVGQDIVTITPLYQGGYFLESTAGTDRLWDSTAPGDNITYGVRFTDGAATVSSIESKSVSAAGAKGDFASLFSCRTGGRIVLNCNAPSSPYDRVQFLRMDESVSPPNWKLLNTDTTEPFLFQDTTLESAVSALTTITTGTSPGPIPTFSTEGIANAFPYKESMVWLFSKGTGNIQISRMGDPEEIYSDEAAANGDYSSTDNTNPARRTMADNAADVPVWGSQIGQIAVVLGSKSAYSFSGDYPEQTTPCREIPGSRGVAGIDAATRYRPVQGQYAVAYADDDLNIWSIGGTPQFVDDASVRPFELSEPVRKKLKAFLLDAQKPEFPSLTVSSVQLEFDDVTSSLWVVLGRRAAVLRQGTGNDGWDLHEYQLTVPPGSATVSTCTAFYTNSAVATSVAPGDAAWSSTGFAFVSDDSYCTSASLGFGTLRTTETLRCDGFTPTTPIPVSATITGLTYQAEFSKTGDLAVTNIDAQPRVAGASSGTDRSTGTTLTTSDVVQDYVPSANPTVAQINAGSVGFDLKFQQETWLATWNDPANWTIGIAPASPNVYDFATATVASHTTNYVVTYTWIGGGTAPTQVWVTHTGSTSLSSVANSSGTGSTDNGLGDTESGAVYALPATPEIPDNTASLGTSSTLTERLTLTAGVATKNITMVSTSTVTPVKMRATHTLSAGIYTPTAAVVRVDNVALKVCYDVTTASSGATTGISIQKLAFVDGLNLGIRNSGQIDVLERYNGTDVSGTGRDGGYSMPDAFFETQDMSFEGAYAQVAQVQVHTDTLADSVTVAFKSDETAYTNGTSIVKARWKRFELSMKGIRFNGKLTFGEGAENISGLTIEYNKKSRGIN